MLEFDEYEVHILRRLIRGSGGSAAIGAGTIDAVSASAGIRADLRGAVQAALESLARRGFLSIRPKPGNHVYSLRPEVLADIRQALAPAETELGSKQGARGRTAEDLGVEPGLMTSVLGATEGQAFVRLISYDASQEVDFEDPDAGKTYRKLCVTLEVTCPGTGGEWILKMNLGIVDAWPLRAVPCKCCDKAHTFRGPRMLSPKR